jgi:hypothetical protein
VVTLWAAPGFARAADLVVGVVHDTDGYPVAEAAVSLRQPSGASAGSGKTSPDGTFAIEAGAEVASVDVRCAYCEPMTVTRLPNTPVVVLVRRFAVLRDRGISAADARVLPYSSVGDMAALLPFVVATTGTISDRGLAGARGSVVADGIALYRSTDGLDLGTMLPAHAVATIAQRDPTAANAYDANSSGGLFSIDTLDGSAGLARIDASNGFDATIRAGSALRGALETSGGIDAASRAVLAATLSAAGGTLDLRAVAAGGSGANANALSTAFARPVRGATLNAALSMTRSADPTGTENDGVAALSLQADGVTLGVRAQRSSGSAAYGTGTGYDVRAFVEAVHDDGRTRIFASLAGAQDGERVNDRTAANAALLPILSVSTRLTPSFTLHADSVDALLPTPLYVLYALPDGMAAARSHLTDAGIGFDDLHRFRIDAMIFRQTVSGPAHGTTGGSGISTVWQIAPSLALRSWTLISRTNGETEPAYPGVTGDPYPTGSGTLDRNVTWITAGSVLRVDAIWRGGNLEGDVSFPAGARVRFVTGTRRDGPNRIFTAGLSWP